MARSFRNVAIFGAFIGAMYGTMASAASNPATVTQAWLRAIPGNAPAGGYFTLTNPSDKPLTLTGASTPACGSTQLHMTHKMGSMVHMMEITKVDIPAKGKFDFAPGGHHIMCMEPKALKPGSKIDVTLQFSDGTSLTVPFAVKSATGK